MKKLAVITFIFLAIIGFVAFILNPFQAPSNVDKTEIVTLDTDSDDVVGLKLKEQGFIKSQVAFDLALTLKNKHNKIQSGGYYLSKNMNVWRIINAITKGPDLKWVTVLEGMRKEQIGERLKKTFGWSDEDLKKWNEVYTAMKYDYVEGVYFPDTYLIPVKEDGLQIALRMINRFNEKLAPFQKKFSEKNIIWTTGLKIASIIQREAAGPQDMPLIAGVLWNRLLKNQKLQIDATIQYAKGKVGDTWWSVVTPSDIQNIDSSYNTYQYAGLPPHPISNPGLDAIKAVLNPEETKCLYYLHDYKGQIHCAVTYEEHLENIKEYLN
ncbi:MAG: endolytic transglycosylase MltG [Candidatus Levybacteria bacterium]|nr:endolytic transglycosylase MltG [Candidatus Levybacteria bacterium]